MKKHVALFEVKAVNENGGDPNGEFEAILSVPTVDRDGEVIDGKAFEPLPAEIPIHKFHDFSAPVATAVQFYEGDVLKARGVFDPDPDAQMIRQKVGRSIRYMSVGFMAATRSDADGVPHITKAELLEASFVSVPSNREAAILAVKAAKVSEDFTRGVLNQGEARVEAKAGRVLSAKNEASLRQAVDILNTVLDLLAASDEDSADKTAATNPEEKASVSAAADAAAEAVADPPAEVPVGIQAQLAVLRAGVALAAHALGTT